MSLFIHDLPLNAYIPTDDIDAFSSYSYPSTSFSEDASLPSHPDSPFDDNYPSHILWAPRLRTVDLPDEEDFVATTAPPLEAWYYEEPYEDELEEDLEEGLQPQMDEIIDWFPPAFVHYFGQDQGHGGSQQHAYALTPSPPPEKHDCIPSRQSIASWLVERNRDAVPLVNGESYGISSGLSPLPQVMVCAPITLYKLLPRGHQTERRSGLVF